MRRYARTVPAAEPPLPALAEPELADVVVVGAGPGGSAAAIALLRAEPGLQVVLADKAGFPRDKCCGDGLGPGVVSVLTELDLLDVVAGETPVEQCAVFGTSIAAR